MKLIKPYAPAAWLLPVVLLLLICPSARAQDTVPQTTQSTAHPGSAGLQPGDHPPLTPAERFDWFVEIDRRFSQRRRRCHQLRMGGTAFNSPREYGPHSEASANAMACA